MIYTINTMGTTAKTPEYLGNAGLESIAVDMQNGKLPVYFGDFSTFEARLRETSEGNGVPVGGRYRKFLISDAIDDLIGSRARPT